jgi:cytochrome c biogenesis protein CcmG/thiol:disulfide interchange protein DsbE
MLFSKLLKFVAPFLILFALLNVLTRELNTANNRETITSNMIGENIPAFSLPYLNSPHKKLTPAIMHGKISIINIWASWCSACKYEHELLMKIKRDYGIPIYGILYKDDAMNAIRYLSHNGNPYTEVGNDAEGDTGIDFGVYGTPETYVVSQTGEIIYRQIGALDQATWDQTIYPLIQKYEKK